MTEPSEPPGRRESGAPEPGAASRRLVLVVGMHRSGTSAVTRVVSLLGAALPRRLLPPGEENAPGFWESEPLVELHDEVLAAAGTSWDEPGPTPESWLASEAAAPFRGRLVDLVREEFPRSGDSVVKDPRLCRLVPLWLEVAAELAAEPLFVLALRNPLAVAASLAKRNGFPPAHSLSLWLWHVLEAERQTRGRRRAIVHYEELLDDWRPAVERLRRELGIGPAELAAETAGEIAGFLSPRHRSHEQSAAALERSGETGRWVRTVYRALREDAGSGDGFAAALDPVREELLAAHTVASGLAAHLHQRADRTTGTALAHARGEIARLEAQSSEDVRFFKSEIDRLRGKIEGLGGEVEGLGGEVEGLGGEVEGLGGAIEGLGGEVEGLGSAIEGHVLQAAKDVAFLTRGSERNRGDIDRIEKQAVEDVRHLVAGVAAAREAAEAAERAAAEEHERVQQQLAGLAARIAELEHRLRPLDAAAARSEALWTSWPWRVYRRLGGWGRAIFGRRRSPASRDEIAEG